MDTLNAVLLAAAVVVVLLLAAAFVWNRTAGLKEFSFAGGRGPAVVGPYTDAKGRKIPVHRFRFVGCTFTSRSPSGEERAVDVTAALNAMAASHADVKSRNPMTQIEIGGRPCTRRATDPRTGASVCAELGEPRPLNSFTFTIPGFNSLYEVPTREEAAKWEAAEGYARLTGRLRLMPS